MELNNYSNFIDRLSDESIHHLAETTRRYFYLAEIQVRSLEKNLEDGFKIGDMGSYAEYCYSYCFGFYTLIRTCLESSQRLSEYFQPKNNSRQLQDYRDKELPDIIEIIKIANNIVKHPLEETEDFNGKKRRERKTVFYELGGLDTLGSIGIYEWSIERNIPHILKNIYPIKDLNRVYKHLENLALIYIDFIKFKKL